MKLVRHGQSHFNVHYSVTREDPGIVDPGLTELGVTQAREAGKTLAGEDIRRIVASPYSRTLETAEIIAGELGLSVTIERLVHERAYFICDIGSPRSHLARRWPAFDFGDLEETWWPANESEADVQARCAEFRAIMATLDDWRHVLVVTHWGFIRGLTGLEVGNAAIVPFDLDGS